MWQLKESHSPPALAWKVQDPSTVSTLRDRISFTQIRNSLFLFPPIHNQLKPEIREGRVSDSFALTFLFICSNFPLKKAQKPQGNPTGMAEIRAFTASQAIFGLKPGILLMDVDGCPLGSVSGYSHTLYFPQGNPLPSLAFSALEIIKAPISKSRKQIQWLGDFISSWL